ncbi:hypothetical protein BS17DRAFT_773061 [Gyrodon lividus]|nr:hypothetical protein BS17DRAFT_773061 [Gyrodon lividus]
MAVYFAKDVGSVRQASNLPVARKLLVLGFFTVVLHTTEGSAMVLDHCRLIIYGVIVVGLNHLVFGQT